MSRTQDLFNKVNLSKDAEIKEKYSAFKGKEVYIKLIPGSKYDFSRELIWCRGHVSNIYERSVAINNACSNIPGIRQWMDIPYANIESISLAGVSIYDDIFKERK